MWFDGADYDFFWLSRWSRPLRAACPHLSDPQQQKAHKKLPLPRWLRSVYVFYGIAQAVAQRAAWLAAHPAATPYRFADSAPCWVKDAALPYSEERLRKLAGTSFWWLFDVNLERLFRIMQADHNEIGQDRWTQAALGTAGHLMQVYRELQRRVGTQQARRLVREECWLFLTLGTEEAVEAAEQLPTPAGQETGGTPPLWLARRAALLPQPPPS